MSEAWTGGMLPAGSTSASVHEFAASADWELVNDEPRTVVGPRFWTWRSAEGEASLIEDHRTGLRYIEARPASFAEQLAVALRLEAPAELFERAGMAADPVDRIRALYGLCLHQHSGAQAAAATAPEDPDHPGFALLPDDTRYLKVFERALLDPERGVQRAGMEGLTYSPWPGSRDVLRRRRNELPRWTERIDEILSSELRRIKKVG